MRMKLENYTFFEGICMPWFPITCQSWSLDDLCNGLIRVFGDPSRLRVSKNLQELWRRKMEI